MDNLADIMQHMAKGGYRLHQQWGLMADIPRRQIPMPDTPVIDEQPALVDEGHARRTVPHGQAGGRRIKIGLGVMCEYDDDAPEPEGTVIFDCFPKIGDEVILPSDGKVWVVTSINPNPYASYPIICKEKQTGGRDE